MSPLTLQSVARSHLEFKQRYAQLSSTGQSVATPEFFFLPRPVWRDMQRAGIGFNDVLNFDKIKDRLTGRHVGLVVLMNSLDSLKHMLAPAVFSAVEQAESLRSFDQEWIEYAAKPDVVVHYGDTINASALDRLMFSSEAPGEGLDEPDYEIKALDQFHIIVTVRAGYFDKELPEEELRKRRIAMRRDMLLELASLHGLQSAMACGLFTGYLMNLADLSAG